jgi:hypothetical protein
MAQEQQDQTIVIPMPSGGGGGVPIPQRNDRAELIDKINPENVITVTRHMLLGEEWTGSTWVKVKELEKDSLTPLGAWKISSQLQGIANLSTSISKYKEELIKARLKRIAQNTQIQLVGNFREYGIKNVSQFYFVHNIIFSIAMAVLFQAGDGSIQDLLGKIKSETTQINTEKKEPGRLRRILGMG